MQKALDKAVISGIAGDLGCALMQVVEQGGTNELPRRCLCTDACKRQRSVPDVCTALVREP
jgi:hypothetical protein